MDSTMAKSMAVCSMSMKAASKPARPMISTTAGSAKET